MDGAWGVILISLAMFVGCFVLGIIPLLINLSEVRRFTFNKCCLSTTVKQNITGYITLQTKKQYIKCRKKNKVLNVHCSMRYK